VPPLYVEAYEDEYDESRGVSPPFGFSHEAPASINLLLPPPSYRLDSYDEDRPHATGAAGREDNVRGYPRFRTFDFATVRAPRGYGAPFRCDKSGESAATAQFFSSRDRSNKNNGFLEIFVSHYDYRE
jgi:hypothetical protein